MAETITELLVQYGYVLLAVMLFVEAVGVPLPGETVLAVAAALAGSGRLSIWGVFLTAISSTVSGCAAGYWLGVRGGLPLINRFGSRFRLSPERMRSIHDFFESHGKGALLAGRFVPLLRSFLGIFAGISEMTGRRFMLYNSLGGLLWSLTVCAFGFSFGRNLPRLIHELGRVSLVLAFVTGVVILLVWWWRWFGAHRPQVVAAIDRRWERMIHSREMTSMHDRYPRAWEFVASRFAPMEYLLVHLAVGWVLSAAVLTLTAVISADILRGSPLAAFDHAVAYELYAAAPESLRRWLRVVAYAGWPPAVTLLALALVAAFGWRRRWPTLIAWIGAYTGSVWLDALLRQLVERRSLAFAAVDGEVASALPAAHTIGAIVGYGFVAYAVLPFVRGRARRGMVVAAAVAVIVAIAAARILLGLGYITTEAASVACGLLWLAACVSGAELAAQQNYRMSRDPSDGPAARPGASEAMTVPDRP